ncbi:oligosaccharide flippase family protein [Sporolactobacillus kofuensis]|uniref:Oligosaccharide flippase family protein n=1 Tax=Sporolactobacillus kofuensis TaxID=269672 RepID=A0ABW1WJE8_9BACL|nr:polysaccharide biosynthesis protein [Sporolactobacillus kofuensis]MCO7176933.1 polysaccharide biosynthesis protein [Sporolactobacillus kofuensis]
MGNKQRESHRVWRGAAILTGAALLVKVMSALYRLPYQNFAGDVGFYVYQQIYPFYALAVALGTTGFPIVISKYMAETDEQSNRAALQRHAMVALLLLCGFFFVFLFFFARALSAFIGDQHLAQLIRIAASVYLFVPMVALLRGTFQGDKENMLPTALSQIGEQLTRVLFILGSSWFLFVNHGNAYQFGLTATAGSAFAPVVSLLILLLFLPQKCIFFQNILAKSIAPIHWRLVKSLIISGCLFSILALPLLTFQLIDSLTVLRLLGKLQLADPRAEKGIYDRAYQLTQFGMIAATSLTAAIVPRLAQLSALQKEHDFQLEATLALKISLAFGAAAAAGLAVISREVNIMLFRNADGTPSFALASLTMLTLSLILTASGILEAAGKPWIPFSFLLIGTLVKGVGNSLLIPRLSITGASLATCIGTAVTAGLCLYYLERVRLINRLPWKTLVKLALALTGMVGAVWVWKAGVDRWSTILDTRLHAALLALSGATIGGIVFIIMMYSIRYLDKRDWHMLPLPGFRKKGANVPNEESRAISESRKL